MLGWHAIAIAHLSPRFRPNPLNIRLAMHAITPTRQQNYSEWYQQVIRAADLAETAPVRGCMIMKPLGYGLWEAMQQTLDRLFKATGHQNIYCPLLIPLSFFEQEAAHVDGFAKECAVVTHRRLATNPDGRLQPAGPLDEPLVIRPTSETMIGAAMAKWIQSYRDLPLLLNQWGNVVRWEMRTRLFLRTSEFLWQEGHTAHATADDAENETRRMLDLYGQFAEDYLAMPVIRGEKCSWERFPGAVRTYSIEAMMQDRKALQAGTSHFLGQNFAKASGIRFQSDQGLEEFAWTTSWGVSTRLIGALIMTHSDDDGLVIPPRLAPYQVVILPIHRHETERQVVMEYCQQLAQALRGQCYAQAPVRVDIDTRHLSGGEKNWSQIKRGTPIRLHIGPRDLAAGCVTMSRRDQASQARQTISHDQLIASISDLLTEIQTQLYQRASAFMQQHTRLITDQQAFTTWYQTTDENRAHGGFALSPFVDDPSVAAQLAPLKVSVRCLPFDQPNETARCLFTGQKTQQWALFAKAY